MRTFGLLICITLFTLFAAGQQRKPDRQIDGYKGGVKRVVTERADLELQKGRLIETKRRLAEDMYYDRAGNRSRSLSYDYISGLLRERATYKTLDGESVVSFDYEDAPGAMIGITSPTPDPETYDPRYDFKFKYKTDAAGNITEEAWWKSNGKLWLRYVYSFGVDKKTELVFSPDGKLDQKYVYIYDPSGNVDERILYDTDHDRPSEKVVYKYLAFDEKGNWIKRSESSGDDKSNFKQKPREMTYRKITYYP